MNSTSDDRSPNPVLQRPAAARLSRAAALVPHDREPHGWFGFNHQCLMQWLNEPPRPGRRVAVFDWDGTCFGGDSAPVAFEHALAALAFRMTPTQLMERLPGRHLTTLEGIDVAALHHDIISAYTQLWPHIQPGADRRQAFTLPAYHDFRAKAAWLTQAYCTLPAHPAITGYAWALWLTGLHPERLTSFVGEACQALRATSADDARWTCATPGAAGLLSHSRETRCSPRPEIIDLWAALRERDVEVWVVTANLQPLVAAMAAHWRYPIKPQHILGTSSHYDTDGNLDGRAREDRLIPFQEGKTAAIRSCIGVDPVLVAGDTNGDAHMLTAFAHTEIKLVLDNRLPGPIEVLYRQAQAFAHNPRLRPRVLLQAVDPHTGALLNAERSPALPEA